VKYIALYELRSIYHLVGDDKLSLCGSVEPDHDWLEFNEPPKGRLCLICEKIANPNYDLTELELIILEGLAKGFQVKEIAFRLGEDYYPTRNKVRSIREKLKAENTNHAIYLAMKRGILE